MPTDGISSSRPETARQYGVKLDWINREILTKAYARQATARVVVSSPTSAVFDTPVWYRCGDKNRLVTYRYVLLVDAATGRLDVLLWSLGADSVECGGGDEILLLKPNTIDEAELIPDRSEFSLDGRPNEAGLGVDKLPPSRERRLLPTEWRVLARQTKFTAAEARELEGNLRQLLETPAQ